MVNEKKVPEIRFEGFAGLWEQASLGSVAEFNPKSLLPDTFEYVDLESVVGTVLESHRTENKKTAPSRAQRLAKSGDVFFQTVRPYQQNNLLFDLPVNNFVFSTGYAQLRPSIDSNFLLARIQEDEFVVKVLDYCTGTSYPAITPTNLALIDIVYPTDPKEQTALGNFFRNLDDTITLKKQQYEQIINIKKAMLEKMFPKKGADVPEIRFDGFSGAWEIKLLGDATELYDNLRIPVAESLRKPGETPYYGANGIQGYIDGYTHDGEYVLVAEDGASDLLNYPVRYVSGRIWANNHVHVLQGKAKETNTLYLSYALKVADFQAVLVGGTRAKLNAGAMKEMSIFITSFEEQILIGNFFRNLDNLISAQQEELEKLQNIKKACLSKMFV